MKFERIKARPDWRARADQDGYLASVLDDPPYWVEALDEPFCGVLTMHEVENVIEAATVDLYEMSMEAVDYVVNGNRSEQCFEALRMPKHYRNGVRRSWRRRDQSIYGRFDFSYRDGDLKMLEMNFDTPTSLYEAAILQWFWMEDLREKGKIPANSDQFNSLHERLIAAFAKVKEVNPIIHMASVIDTPEDEDTVRYLQSCAMQAGMDVRFLYMSDLGFDDLGQLIDLDGKVIEQLFKLYPWEHIVNEDADVKKNTGRHVFSNLNESNLTKFIEPSWKMILSNKAIMTILWDLFPGHRNLLETTFDTVSAEADSLRQRPHVKKPIFGREGGSVSIIDPDRPDWEETKESVYGSEGYILQALHTLPTYDDYHLVMGSWVVDGQPAGIGLRADRSKITGNTAIFVPHYIDN